MKHKNINSSRRPELKNVSQMKTLSDSMTSFLVEKIPKRSKHMKDYKILIVEDDIEVKDFFKTILEQEDYQVTAVESAEKALKILDDDFFEIILVDYILPEMSGLELLKLIKEKHTDSIRLLITGYPEVSLLEKAINEGEIYRFLKKPVRLYDLRVTVKNAAEHYNLMYQNKKLLRSLEEKVKEKTKKLIKSEAKFKTIADFSYDWETFINKDGGIVYVSPAFERITGYKVDEYISGGVSFNDLFCADDLPKINEYFSRFLKGESFNDIEFRLKRKNDELRYISISAQPVIADSGECVGFRSSIRDITDRKKAEEALIQEQSNLEIMLKHKSLLANIASRLISTNSFPDIINEILKAIAVKTGISKVNLYLLDPEYKKLFWYSNGSKKVDHSLIKDIQSSPFSNFPWLIERLKKGENIVLSNNSGLDESIRPFFTSQGISTILILPISIADKVIGLIYFSQNNEYTWKSEMYELFKTITDIIANDLERHYHFHGRIEAEKNHTEAVQTAEKALRLASVGTLAAGIAHEINQPLNALKVTLDGILYWKNRGYETSQEELIKILKFISEQAVRIDGIIRQMRILARHEKSTKLSLININNIIQNALFLVRKQMSVYGIKAEVNLDDSLPPIKGHSTQIEQVLINLITNSMNALNALSKGNKMISICTRFADGNCILEVMDNGPGIPPKYLKQIFDSFFTTKIGGEGMGLGLSITRNIIDELGGTISAENRQEGGAHFTVSIPVPPNKKRRSNENPVGR